MTIALVLLAVTALQPLVRSWAAKRPAVIRGDEWTDDVLKADRDRLALAKVLGRP
jgi:hypothetical protein